jgi:hypothetical protein
MIADPPDFGRSGYGRFALLELDDVERTELTSRASRQSGSPRGLQLKSRKGQRQGDREPRLNVRRPRLSFDQHFAQSCSPSMSVDAAASDQFHGRHVIEVGSCEEAEHADCV